MRDVPPFRVWFFDHLLINRVSFFLIYAFILFSVLCYLCRSHFAADGISWKPIEKLHIIILPSGVHFYFLELMNFNLTWKYHWYFCIYCRILITSYKPIMVTLFIFKNTNNIKFIHIQLFSSRDTRTVSHIYIFYGTSSFQFCALKNNFCKS